ncbi:MAG: hypothetical protein FWC69_05480, partial [Defluviitaleaceae bacterium]|nr:hypothetical protein [Defluviitaleaceae bacterium]
MIYTKDNYDINKIGGKAAALAKLSKVFDNIPEWFAIGVDGASKVDVLNALGCFEDNTLFAVRSSALGEDGAEHSFAGQFESYLNVPKNKVWEHVLKVQASAESPRVQAYKAQHGIKSISAPAVLVQKMVNADYAGVAFAANPITGDTRECVISAVEG